MQFKVSAHRGTGKENKFEDQSGENKENIHTNQRD